MGWQKLVRRKNGMVGLAYYVVEVENKEFLVNLFTQAQDWQEQLRWISSSEFSVTDKDGIVTRVRVEN